MAETLPRQIGPYRPAQRIGAGGMGVVYRAEDTRRPGLFVALKVTLDTTDLDATATRRRFEREARILEGLRHPNIVSFFEVGMHEGREYFAMELLSGSSLAEYCGRPYRETIPLLDQICDGMDYLASASIVHRDLSPGNIFVVDTLMGRTAKILDFGVAKDLASNGTLHDLTRTGMLMGKPAYWSPDQLGALGRGVAIDYRSDIYALGVIFYRVFSGSMPFEEDSPSAYATVHLFEAAPTVSAPPGNPPLPNALVEIVDWMLAKHRDDRPGYDLIKEALKAALSGETETRPLPRPASRKATLTLETVVDDEETKPLVNSGDGTSRTLTDVTAVEEPTVPTVEATTQKEWLVPGAAQRLPRGAPRAGQGWRWLLASVVLLVVAGLGVGIWSHGRKEEVEVGGIPVRPSSGAGAGTLSLDAVPWARIVAITQEGSGSPVAIGSELTTPLRMELPPGRYVVQLDSGTRTETRHISVAIVAGRESVATADFGSPRATLRLLE